MFKFSANKIFAASALLLCAGFAQAQEAASPLTANPSSVAVTWVLGTGSTGAVPITVTAATGTDAFVITPSDVPFWVTLGGTGLAGPATTAGVQVTFNANAYAASLGAGTYTQNVHFAVSGFQDLVIPVTLSVQAGASTLSASVATTTPSIQALTSGQTYTGSQIAQLNWTYGSSPQPTLPITITSSDSPVAFTASVVNPNPAVPANWVILSATTGIAYNFGTGLTVSFLPDVLNNAAVGGTVGFTLNIVYGSTTLAYTFTITVEQPVVTVSSTAPIYPAYTPPVTSGTLKVVVNGSGFSNGTTIGGTDATTVKLTYGPGPVGPTAVGAGVLASASALVVSPNTMILTIPFEDATAVTPINILGVAGQNVLITISSAVPGQVAINTTLTVTSNPIIDTVTDAGSLVEPPVGTAPTFAPYEMITIFGNNFCNVACTGGVAATLTASRYPTTLVAGSNNLSVAFNNQTGTLIQNAYLIYANDTQINALVPSNVVGTGITGLQIIATSGTNASNTFVATPVASNPGIFTTAASGQGQGAILNSDYSVNSSTNPALTTSVIQIYASGLGVPNSTAASAVLGKAAPVFPTACFSPATYVTDEALTSPATMDGAVLLPTVWGTGNLPPCFATKNYVTAKINGVAATVDYAGWVADSVAGLYQINVTVPATATTSTLTAVSVPVVLTVDGVQTQPGVTLYIKK